MDEALIISSPVILNGSQYSTTLPTSYYCMKSLPVLTSGTNGVSAFIS
jgi:hypothetical protein